MKPAAIELPIERHPNFAAIAGTPENPKPGASFNRDGTFAGFTSTTMRGIKTFMAPIVAKK